MLNKYDFNERKTGKWSETYNYGLLHAKGNYVNGKEHGYWKCYYKDNNFRLYPMKGNLFWEGNYINGKEDGEWKVYYDNGNLWERGNYLNGKKDGYWKYYYKNGDIDKEGNYINGKENGEWKFYHDKKLYLKINYLNGKNIREYVK